MIEVISRRMERTLLTPDHSQVPAVALQGHPPSSNQSSLSPILLASSRSCSVVLAFSCHSLQDPEQPQTLSSSLLSTCPYHLTPIAVANRSIVFLNPNMLQKKRSGNEMFFDHKKILSFDQTCPFYLSFITTS